MFDIGWTEMLVVACVAIIVVGPKDLPKVLRGFGKAMKSMRSLAGDFQKQFDEAIKEAELDDVKNIASGKGFKPLDDIKKSVTDYEKDVKERMAAKSGEKSEPVGLPEPVAAKLKEMDDAAAAKAAATEKSATKKTATAKAPAKTSAKPASKPAGKASKPAAAKSAPKTTAKATAAKKPAPAKKTPAKKAATGKTAKSA